MRITPLEIRNHPFSKVMMGGFDKDQVESFLQQVASQVEDLSKENGLLATKLKEVTTDIDRYQKIENVLNETLYTAQRATDEAKANAQKEAELIIRDAEVRADRYVNESREKTHALKNELVSLEAQKKAFLARFETVLSDQLKYLEVMKESLE